MAFLFDHIAIAADNLAQGVDYIEQKLGVKIPFGGLHDQMGTHNHLMQIGDGIFLELIAINPNANPPNGSQKRWFNLDNPELQAELKQQPKLVTWIARTPNIKTETATLQHNIGAIHNVTRGALSWQITIPQNGELLENGLFPTLIEWQNNQTPAANMQDLGIRLTEFTLTHPNPDKLQNLLSAYGPSPQFELKIQKGDYNLSAKFTNQSGDILDI